MLLWKLPPCVDESANFKCEPGYTLRRRQHRPKLVKNAKVEKSTRGKHKSHAEKRSETKGRALRRDTGEELMVRELIVENSQPSLFFFTSVQSYVTSENSEKKKGREKTAWSSGNNRD